MRTTIDIPDEIYRKLKVKAAQEGRTVREIALRGIQREMEPAEMRPARKKFEIPVIPSTRPGTLHLTNEDIDDIPASS
jgi:plasmid stability protein